MESSIKFDNMSKFEQKVVLEAIDSCLTLATKYDGRVYGGFVRDVIIPKMVNLNCDVRFKDVDIWFDKQSNAAKFIDEMGDELKMKHHISTETYPGAFKRTQYHLIGYDTILAFIDVIISDNLPVDDLDVNTITYQTHGYGYYATESIVNNNLIEQIKAKRAIMMQSYVDKCSLLEKSNPILYKHFTDRITKLKKNGWTILSPCDLWLSSNDKRNSKNEVSENAIKENMYHNIRKLIRARIETCINQGISFTSLENPVESAALINNMNPISEDKYLDFYAKMFLENYLFKLKVLGSPNVSNTTLLNFDKPQKIYTRAQERKLGINSVENNNARYYVDEYIQNLAHLKSLAHLTTKIGEYQLEQ